MLVAACQKLSK